MTDADMSDILRQLRWSFFGDRDPRYLDPETATKADLAAADARFIEWALLLASFVTALWATASTTARRQVDAMGDDRVREWFADIALGLHADTVARATDPDANDYPPLPTPREESWHPTPDVGAQLLALPQTDAYWSGERRIVELARQSASPARPSTSWRAGTVLPRGGSRSRGVVVASRPGIAAATPDCRYNRSRSGCLPVASITASAYHRIVCVPP